MNITIVSAKVTHLKFVKNKSGLIFFKNLWIGEPSTVKILNYLDWGEGPGGVGNGGKMNGRLITRLEYTCEVTKGGGGGERGRGRG